MRAVDFLLKSSSLHADASFRRVRIIYLVAFALIAAVATISHLIVHNIVNRQELTARIVNVSGRQRMLSQRSAMLALELAEAKDSEAQKNLAQTLNGTLTLMETSHRFLNNGDPDQDVSFSISPEIAQIYTQPPFDLNKRVNDYISLLNRYAALSPDDRMQSPLLREILVSAHSDILDPLDAAVRQYQTDSETAIRSLRHMQQALLGVMYLTLIAEGVLIFLPLFRLLEKSQKALQESARTDPLTGCLNRRYLVERAETEFKRAVRNGTPITVLMIDIDHFKKVNDTYGHACGDEAIRALVKQIVGRCRGSDILGRLGGEEFALVLPETGMADAAQIAESLRTILESTPLEAANSTFGITISIGLATARAGDPVKDFFKTLEYADEALYRAKDQGRNRVIAA